MKLKYFVVISLLGMGACAPKPSTELQNSIEANATAQSAPEWDASKHHPTAVFKRFRQMANQDPAMASASCAAFANFGDQDLTLFEREIKRPENLEIVKPCKAELVQRIETYWRQQQQTLVVPKSLDFRFKTEIQTRDLTKGYRARTGDVHHKELILTFDDGPDGQYTPKILDILKSVDAKVMFFTVGKNVEIYPEIVHREARDGHVIGSHSMAAHAFTEHVNGHLCLSSSPICAKANGGSNLTFEEAKEEIRAGHEAVYKAAGFVDPFFRFPFGESDPQLSQFMADNQIGQFYWNIDSNDWKNRPLLEVFNDVMNQVDKAQRGIVLFHDVHRRTLEILPAVLRALYDRGYSLVIIHPENPSARWNSPLLTPPLIAR